MQKEGIPATSGEAQIDLNEVNTDPQVFDTKNKDHWKELFNGEDIQKQSELSPQEIEVMRQKWLKTMSAKVRKQKRGTTKSPHNTVAKKSKRKAHKFARKKNR